METEENKGSQFIQVLHFDAMIFKAIYEPHWAYTYALLINKIKRNVLAMFGCFGLFAVVYFLSESKVLVAYSVVLIIAGAYLFIRVAHILLAYTEETKIAKQNLDTYAHTHAGKVYELIFDAQFVSLNEVGSGELIPKRRWTDYQSLTVTKEVMELTHADPTQSFILPRKILTTEQYRQVISCCGLAFWQSENEEQLPF